MLGKKYFGLIIPTQRSLGHGADISVVNMFSSSAVHIAAKTGNLECLKILIENDAEINNHDGWGYTPLDVAKYKNRKVAYSFLTRIGAKCNACCHRRFGVKCR